MYKLFLAMPKYRKREHSAKKTKISAVEKLLDGDK